MSPHRWTPSGSFAPVVVTVTNGSNAERDILMLQDEIAQTHPGSGSTYANPAALPQGGGWGSWISGYGSTDWFEFTAQANRTASVSVTALDETGQPTETKLLARNWDLAIERPERQSRACVHTLGIQHDHLGTDPPGCAVRRDPIRSEWGWPTSVATVVQTTSTMPACFIRIRLRRRASVLPAA